MITLLLLLGTTPIANEMATVTVELDCGITYTIIATGTLNGASVGLRLSYGNITIPACPEEDTSSGNGEKIILFDCVHKL